MIRIRSQIVIQITFCSATNALEMGLRMKMDLDLDLDPDLPILEGVVQDEGSQRGVERAAA